jgi:NNP family nitrate/nitrite transporter-like MFS transporter
MRFRQLALATIAFAISFSVWGLVSALAPRFKEIYRLSDTQTALAVALPVVLGALFRIPMGILADRYGGRLVFSLLLAFAVLPAAAIALIDSYPALLIGGFLLGAVGSSFAVGVSFTTKWFTAEQQGLALGIFGIGNIGQSIAVFFAPRLAHALSWEAVFWLFGGVSVLWAGVFWAAARDAAPGRPVSARHMAEILLHRRLSWILAFFYFITFGGFVALGVYLPTLLHARFGLSPDDAGLRTAGFVVLATLMRPLGGWLSDRVGGARLLVVVFGLLAVLALLLISSDFVVFSVGALGIAALLGLGNGAVFKLVPQCFPGDVGVVTGLVGALGGLGGFFPPLVLGILKQSTGGYTPGFVLLAAFAVAALVVNLLTFVRQPGSGQPGQALPSARSA